MAKLIDTDDLKLVLQDIKTRLNNKTDLEECIKKTDMISLTQSEYDALETKDGNTFYFIKNEN